MSALVTDFGGTNVDLHEAQIRARLLDPSQVSSISSPESGNQSRTKTQNGSRFIVGTFRVEGTPVVLPEQRFNIYSTETAIRIQNTPTDNWPILRFTFPFSDSDTAWEGNVEVIASSQTAEGILLHTRLAYALKLSGRCTVTNDHGMRLLDISGDATVSGIPKELRVSAKIFRKIRFIEDVFHTTFDIPAGFSASDFRDIELVFRGVTEGEFTTRTSDIVFHYLPSVSELAQSPFLAAGAMTKTFTNTSFRILGKELDVGPQTISIEKAIVADPRAVIELKSGRSLPDGFRIIVLDSQVQYRFEKYVKRSTIERSRRLEQFESRLLRDEPEELVSLLRETLISEVSSTRAIQIVSGWLQFYDFPDRYCPQDPVLEENRWRVPIWITYPDRGGARIQDLFVDLKTGVVTTSSSPEEIRNLGRSAASQLLRAV